MSRVDNLFQFVDCIGVCGRQLARDIRCGIVPVEYPRIVIALGNTAALDGYTDVTRTVAAVVNAIVERYGALNVEIYVLSVLPRPRAAPEEVDIIKQQNRSLFKMVRGVIHRRQLPIKFVTAHKWFLKWVKHPDGTVEVEVDTIYFETQSDALSSNGQVHLHLLMAKLMGLKKIQYSWQGMPVVAAKHQRVVVSQEKNGGDIKSKGKKPKQLKKGYGNRMKSSYSDYTGAAGSDSSAPELVVL